MPCTATTANLEVAACPHAIHLRDSKNPAGPHLALSATTWSAFLRQAAL